jgi:hypothetical protein
MGREIRRVPPNWEHPKDEDGEYIPLEDKDVVEASAEWAEAIALFAQGKHPEQSCYDGWDDFLEDFGEPYIRTFRTRIWTDEEATHYQFYENVTEGTPCSPVLDYQGMFDFLVAHGYGPDPSRNIESGLA